MIDYKDFKKVNPSPCNWHNPEGVPRKPPRRKVDLIDLFYYEATGEAMSNKERAEFDRQMKENKSDR